MKRKHIWITFVWIVISLLIVAVVMMGVSFHKRIQSEYEYKKLLNLSVSNAVFCLNMYENDHYEYGYEYAIGEIGTIFNLAGCNKGLKQDETNQAKVVHFYQYVVTKPELAKSNIPKIIEILHLLEDHEEDAYTKMGELTEGIELY